MRQLGNESFAKRQAASEELEAIGEPVLGDLRKAVDDTDDAEIRWRAEQVIQAVTAHIHAAAAKKELAKWEGDWEAPERGETFHVKGDRWAWTKAGNAPSLVHPIEVVERKEKTTHVDLVFGEGTEKGKVCKAMFRFEGDVLHYCGTYNEARPSEFRTTDGYLHVAWKRVKK